MSRRRRLLIAAASVVVAAAVVAGVLLARDGPAPPTAVRANPESSGLALRGSDPITGKSFNIAQYRGKPVVINFWASWCPGCYREAKDFARFAAAHPEAGVVGINFRDDTAAARGFYRRFDWRFPSVADPRGRIAARLRLQGMPTTIFLDARHREVARIVGETDFAGFTRGLERATGSR
jgi:thiol-disulfide isomerase/thioredoxin